MKAASLPRRIAKRVLPSSWIDRLKATAAFQRWHYCERLRGAREDEEPDLAVVKHLVGPGDVTVDAGAHFGLYTKFLSRYVGPAGRVHCFEPVPRTFEILRHNARRLGWRNAVLHRCALSDAPGRALMEIPTDATGVENDYLSRLADPRSGDASGRFEVEVQTLDAVLPPEARPAFVKVDVEGHELSCLRGARSTLARCAPAWLIEVTRDPDDAASEAFELFGLLEAKGYAAYWLDGTRLRPRRHGDRAVNHFFLKPEHLARLQARGVSLR